MAVNEHGGFEDDERVARLYREAAREEPPPHLDRALRAAAREGAGRPAPARTTTSSWWAPWRLPFAFAALAVVSVSLVTLMIEEDRERVASVPAAPPPAAYERQEAKIAQPPVEAPASIEAPRDAERSRRAQRQDARKLEPESAPEAPSTSSLSTEPARAEAPAAAVEAGPRTLQARPSPEVARHIVELESKPPAVWIERVLTLRREGRVAEADGLLAEFRQRFPGEPLPAELQ